MDVSTQKLVGLVVLAFAMILLNVYLMHDMEHRELYQVILLLSD